MKKLILGLIVLTFIFTGCSSIKVTAEHDSGFDFTQPKTYSYLGWSKNSDQLLNDFNKKRIEDAFANEFSLRGIKYAESGGDIEISLYLVTDTKTATTSYTDYYGRYGAYSYRRPWGWGAGYATTTYHEYDYTVGTLICDVFDAKEKQMVWQGVGSGTINENSNNRDKNIQVAVKKIMSLYPIQIKK